MTHRGVGEHVGAVADGRDYELLRRGELRAHRGAESPTEAARRREAVKRAGLFARAVLQAERIFVEDDRLAADRFADGGAEGCGVERSRACLFGSLDPPRLVTLGQFRAPRIGVELSSRQRRIERSQGNCSGRGNRQIARKRAHRIARVDRVLADMHDTAARGRPMHVRVPRRIALDHDDQVGVADQRAGVVARVHGMRGWQRQRCGPK